MCIDKIKALTSKRYELTPLVVEQTRDMGNTFNEVVKAHLLTELFLEELVKLAVPEIFDAFKSIKLKYSQKLEFVSKLQLTDDFPLLDEHTIGSLRKLNRMRNDFSHRLGHSVTDEEVEALYAGHLPSVKDFYGDEVVGVGQSMAIVRYVFCIFGNMFPKYEFEHSA